MTMRAAPQARTPDADSHIVPVLGALSGAIMTVLLGLLLGPHLLLLAPPALGFALGLLFVKP